MGSTVCCLGGSHAQRVPMVMVTGSSLSPPPNADPGEVTGAERWAAMATEPLAMSLHRYPRRRAESRACFDPASFCADKIHYVK